MDTFCYIEQRFRQCGYSHSGYKHYVYGVCYECLLMFFFSHCDRCGPYAFNIDHAGDYLRIVCMERKHLYGIRDLYPLDDEYLWL